MKLDLHSDSEVCLWVEKFGFTYSPDMIHSTLAIRDDAGTMIGACIFTDYSGLDVELHLFGRPCVRRSVFHFIFHYVVDHLKCRRLTIRQKDSDMRARKLAKFFGFKEEGRIRKHYGDEDAIILGLLKEEYNGLT